MKKAAGITTSLLLLISLLSSTMGLSMYRHICSASGKIESSVVNNFGCCSSEEEEENGCETPLSSAETAFSHDCCSISLSLLKSDFISVVKEISSSCISVPFATIPFSDFNLFSVIYKTDFLFETDTSPPSGRDILIQKQSFLI